MILYRHFKLSAHLVVCDWANEVGELYTHEGERRNWKACSRCQKEVKFDGEAANVVNNNSPAHLGGDDRIELYRRKQTGAVLNYYHPLRTEFVRDFGPLASEESVSRDKKPSRFHLAG